MARGGNSGKIEYRKEFFDRDYTAREAYRRVWKYARKYKLRLVVGVISGMLTAGTLVPFFQIVQPALQHVESHDRSVAGRDATDAVSAASSAEEKGGDALPAGENVRQSGAVTPSAAPKGEKKNALAKTKTDSDRIKDSIQAFAMANTCATFKAILEVL